MGASELSQRENSPPGVGAEDENTLENDFSQQFLLFIIFYYLLLLIWYVSKTEHVRGEVSCRRNHQRSRKYMKSD